MKIKYLLLYGIPALIIGGLGIFTLISGSMNGAVPVSTGFFVEPEPMFSYILRHLKGMIFSFPLIILAGVYIFWSLNQEYVNRYTNWSVLSWYAVVPVFILLAVFGLFVHDGEGMAFLSVYVFFITLVGSVLSVLCAHIMGLAKDMIKPKILNLLFTVSAFTLVIVWILPIVLSWFK